MARGQSQAADTQLNTSNQYAAQGNQRANDIFGSLFPTLQNQYSNPNGVAAAPTVSGSQIADPQGFSQILGLNNTSGFSAGDKNNMTTASNQSLGGAVGGAVGQGDLEAARTHNAGGYASALDDAVRSAGRQQSQNALGVQEDSAKLGAQQQETNDQMRASEQNASDTLKQQEIMRNADLAETTGTTNANLAASRNIADAQLKAAQQSSALQGMEGMYGESMQQLLSSLGLGPGTLNSRAAGQSGAQEAMGWLGAATSGATAGAGIHG